MNRNLNIEFKVTNDCNLRCKYCFEHGSFNSKQIENFEIVRLLERVELLIKSEEFKERFDSFSFTLWGGEPSLNYRVCKDIIEFAEKHNTSVNMYTNGTGLKRFYKFIRSGVLRVQISYDGEQVNSMMRVDKKGKPVSNFVRQQIDKLIEAELPFTLKSTITPDKFKYMTECWDDIKEIRDKAKHYSNNINYSPTIDYYNIDTKYEDDLKEAMVLIAKKEYNSYEEGQPLVMSWFGSKEEAYCSAGKNIIMIDTNGDIYPCHGCLYAKENNKNKLNWCSIYDDNFINIITEKADVNKEIMYNVPENCKNLYYTYNVRCNSEAFNKSKHKNYEARWTDYTNYLPMNKYFEIISKVSMALNKSLEK